MANYWLKISQAICSWVMTSNNMGMLLVVSTSSFLKLKFKFESWDCISFRDTAHLNSVSYCLLVFQHSWPRPLPRYMVVMQPIFCRQCLGMLHLTQYFWVVQASGLQLAWMKLTESQHCLNGDHGFVVRLRIGKSVDTYYKVIINGGSFLWHWSENQESENYLEWDSILCDTK